MDRIFVYYIFVLLLHITGMIEWERIISFTYYAHLSVMRFATEYDSVAYATEYVE